MVGADPETFFIPPCVSHQGWVGMRLGGAQDWREVEEVVKRSYRLVAPKRLAELSVKGGRIWTSVPKRWLTFPAFESSRQKPFQPKQRPISSIDFGAMAAPSYRSSLSRASRSSDMQCSRGCRRLAMLSVSGRLPFWHRIAGGVSLRCSSERVYPVQKPTVGRASLSWEIPTTINGSALTLPGRWGSTPHMRVHILWDLHFTRTVPKCERGHFDIRERLI
jgi:hypothetical protein